MRRAGLKRLFLAAISVGAVTGFPAWADETCGLKHVVYDAIFIDGFEPPGPNGFGPPLDSVGVPAFGVTPSLTITYPTSTTTTVGQTAVVGTYTGPTVTGVSVAGVAAYTLNGTFVVPRVLLNSGSNTLTAVATALDGASASTQVTLSYTATAPDLSLVPDQPIGPAPFSVGYVLTVPFDYSSSSFDFGDGSPAYIGSPDTIPRHTYSAPGVYTAQATVVDTASHTHQVAVKIGIYATAQVRTQLCSVYAYLRARLAANDSSGALTAFTDLGKDRFHDYLTAGTTNLPALGMAMGTLAGGMLAPNYAEMMAVTQQASSIKATPVIFALGPDGVWRIESL